MDGGRETQPERVTVEVEIKQQLVERAADMELDLSRLMERAIELEEAARRRAEFYAANREAIDVSNRDIELNGLWADDYRPW